MALDLTKPEIGSTGWGADVNQNFEDIEKVLNGYACVVDMKPQNTNGGSFASGDWRTRDLNVTLANPGKFITMKGTQYGSDETADAASTTSTVVIAGKDVTSDYAVGRYVENTSDETWHLITASAYSGGDTTLTVYPAAATAFDGLTVKSYTLNQVELPAGTYRVKISVPAYVVTHHQAHLYNATDASVELVGSVEQCGSGAYADVQTRSIIAGMVQLAATKTLEVRHRSSHTRNSDGFGDAGGLTYEVYTIAEFWKMDP